MILGLFLNACILIAFLSIFIQIVKDKAVLKKLSLISKLIMGGCAGLLGIVLMLNSVHITSNIIIDFRYVPLLLATMYGGFIPSIIAAAIIGIFRFLFLGISSESINALIVALVIGIGFGFIDLQKTTKKIKFLYAMIFLVIVVSISSFIAFEDMEMMVNTLLIFFTSYFFVSYFVLKYADYMIETVLIHQKLKQEATKDYLTGLNNVREFDNSFNSISQMAIRKEEELSLLFIDIDFFKKINDTYGHNAGDCVLKGLAQILLETCRVYDIVSRNGGEEFSIILMDCSASKAVQKAEKIRKNVEKYNFELSDNRTVNITVSIGIASYPDNTKQINNLPEYADTALYQAKRSGRNKVVLYENDNCNNVGEHGRNPL